MSDDVKQTLTQELQTIDPGFLEQKMLEKEADSAPVAPESMSQFGNPEDIAAAFFKQNFPRVKGLLAKLSKRGIQRAVICAAAYPLVPDGYKPKDEDEHKLAWALEQMIACKSMMIEATKLHKIESINDIKPVDESLSLTKGDENGSENA